MFLDKLNFLKEDAEIDRMTRMPPDFWANSECFGQVQLPGFKD
jgi:hypothetical protein